MILGETTNLFLTCQCHSLTVRVAACPLEFSLIVPSECSPVACFASVHGINSFPTYILVFTSSSRCSLRYLFHFLVESDRFHFKIVQSIVTCLQLHVERPRSGVVRFLARHVTIWRDFNSCFQNTHFGINSSSEFMYLLFIHIYN